MDAEEEEKVLSMLDAGIMGKYLRLTKSSPPPAGALATTRLSMWATTSSAGRESKRVCCLGLRRYVSHSLPSFLTKLAHVTETPTGDDDIVRVREEKETGVCSVREQ